MGTGLRVFLWGWGGAGGTCCAERSHTASSRLEANGRSRTVRIQKELLQHGPRSNRDLSTRGAAKAPEAADSGGGRGGRGPRGAIGRLPGCVQNLVKQKPKLNNDGYAAKTHQES